MSDKQYKLTCDTCHTRLWDNEVLSVPNPFDGTEPIYGCPICHTVNDLSVVCDEPNCWLKISCGTPTPAGYRRTCREHVPEDTLEEK